ncbi:hypothetical protein GCM10023224_20750 [Streptomonospora halophila]|uniref:Activator of Hsp90 ATPase homologue 1/2-like C-terminal domain-containing protein n=1 Tax=Streptomonospora halophila TaxID=427369 RepID=A0ABP9GDI3_9ACTN
MSDALRRVGDQWALRFERRFAHPPERVWRAITEPEHLGRWYPLTPAELAPRVGGAIVFEGEDGAPGPRAEITEFLPSRVFALREYDEETGTHGLRLELEPDGEGCRMVFTHTFADDTWAAQTETGWIACLDELGRVLDEMG